MSMNNIIEVPLRYLPKSIKGRDREKLSKMLVKSRNMYKKGKYYTRKNVGSYKNKKSNHILNAKKIYNITDLRPNKELATKTGCKLSALNKIVSKGEGAYYSSGSRPNQTPQSWGLARLASSITAGKAAAVDYNILRDGCDHNKRAFKLANKSRRKYKYGHTKTRKAKIVL